MTGPFTVESLSPHRALAFAGSEPEANRETISESTAAAATEGPNFEQSILDNLAKAGIQNGRRNERIVLASLEAYAGSYIQAVGERAGANGDQAEPSAPSRIGVAVGPQYGLSARASSRVPRGKPSP